jgi:hypothetical protein
MTLLALSGTAAATSDTAATRAYLQSVYALDQATLHNAPASRAAVTTLARRMGNECRGVLAGAPKEDEGPPSQHTETPRARGERERSFIQMQTIQEELFLTTFSANYQPDRAAIEAFAGQVAPLSWSDPRIAPLVHFQSNGLQGLPLPPTVNVCADMKAWAQSGYHRLSLASREFEAAQKSRSEGIRPRGSIKALLKPYEGPSERALIRRTEALHPKLTDAFTVFARVVMRLDRTLGLPRDEQEEREREPVLGRGTTHAGTTFIVHSETSGDHLRASCHHPVAYDFEERSKKSSSGSAVCLGARAERQPSGMCGGGVESIAAVVPASVRTVRLLLSNGQAISSRVVRIPPRYGGPRGLYLQAVRGYSPHPVSITELDRNGHVVAVRKLDDIRCQRESPTSGPTFVTLATATAPGGQTFTLNAIIVHFGRGQSSFNLAPPFSLHSTEDGSSDGAIGGEPKPKAFSWSVGWECPPHEVSVVYGILSAPGDSVLARTPEGLVPLTKVPIAAHFHSGGPLVYGAFATLPSELIVRRSDGSTLYSESLLARGKEDAEFCAGYAEG